MHFSYGLTRGLKVIALCVLCWWGLPVLAHDYEVGDLSIVHPWSYASPPGAPGVGYFVIFNNGDQPDKLVSMNAEFAQVSAHRTTVTDGMVRMTPVPEGVVVPAGDRISFEPGGLHLMLTDLSRPLQQGEERAVTLHFEQAGSITVNFNVMRRGEEADHGG